MQVLKAKGFVLKCCPVPEHRLFSSQTNEHLLITILLDHGYHPDKIIDELEKIYPALAKKIKLKLSPQPSKAQKKAEGKSGFVPVKARWVIERFNAWYELNAKSLVLYRLLKLRAITLYL